MQKTIKVIANNIVYSNLWIGLGAVAFSSVAAILLQYDLPYQFLAFIFSTTLFTYNFQRIVKIKLTQSQPISGPRANWVKENLIFVYVITSLSALSGLYFGWVYLKSYALLIIIVGFFSFFYVWKLPFLKRNMRSIPGIKIFILSGTWVLATNVLPFYLFSEWQLSINSLLIFLSSFLFICAISIPFDIRDIAVDDIRLRTIPQMFGVKSSIWLGIFMIFLSALLVVFAVNIVPIGFLTASLFATITIHYSDRYSDELLFSGLVDGTLVLQGILVILFH